MTIFFVSTEFNYCCGVSRSIFSLVKELKKRGHTIILGTPGGTMVDDVIECGISFEYIPILPLKKNIKNFRNSISRIKSVVRKYKVDVIHTHNRYAELLSLISNVSLGIRTVTTSHSLILGKRLISFRSQSVIAPSNAVKTMLLNDFKVKANRVRLIRNIPRSLQTPPDDKIASFKKSLRLSETDYIVAGIGRLHWEKGFDILLKAIKYCDNTNIRVILVGNGDEKNSLEEYAESNKLKVTFINEISEVELIYSIADVVVLPSRRDAAPLVAIEAAFFAKPVIATKVGGLVETIKDGNTGILVNPESPEEMASAIAKIYDNREMALQLGKQLCEYVRNEYNAEVITSHIEALYSGHLSDN